MLKKLTIILVIFCFLNSQDSRVSAITGINETVIDYTNINSFASYLLKYNNIAHLTFSTAGNYDTYSFGTNLALNKEMFIGLYLNKPLTNTFASNSPLNPTGLTLNKETELLFGMKLSDMELALGLSTAADAATNETNANKTDNSIRDIGVRAGISIMNIDAEVRFNTSTAKRDFTDKNTATNNTETEWATSGFAFNGRITHDMSKKMKVLGIAKFMTGSGDQKITDQNTANDKNLDEATLSAFQIAAAVNYQINNDNLFIIAVQPFSSFKTETTRERANGATEIRTDVTTITNTILPAFYAGVESRISSWLTGRFGVSQIFGKRKTETTTTFSETPANNTTTETTAYSNDFAATFGLGMEFSNFNIDLLFNEGLLSDGPYIISGANNSLSSKLTVTYSF